MTRNVNDRLKGFFGKSGPVPNERVEDATPALAIRVKRTGGITQISFEHDRCAVIQRVGDGSGRMSPFDSMLAEWERREEWGPDCKGMNGRSEIVVKAGKRKRQGARAATNGWLRFVNFDSIPGLS